MVERRLTHILMLSESTNLGPLSHHGQGAQRSPSPFIAPYHFVASSVGHEASNAKLAMSFSEPSNVAKQTNFGPYFTKNKDLELLTHGT